jgi:protein-S-isoprenylcysteine O-methyltransferase Ste14
VLLVAAKAAVAVSWTVLALGVAGVPVIGRSIQTLRPAAILIGVLGLIPFVLGLHRLGRSVRVGLPVDATELRTTGVYTLSRNPVYVGVFLVCLASCLYVPHWLNLTSTLVAALVHHRIVLAEERFLADRFGTAWEAYKARVRRYV